jgi:hypothetical protein
VKVLTEEKMVQSTVDLKFLAKVRMDSSLMRLELLIE